MNRRRLPVDNLIDIDTIVRMATNAQTPADMLIKFMADNYPTAAIGIAPTGRVLASIVFRFNEPNGGSGTMRYMGLSEKAAVAHLRRAGFKVQMRQGHAMVIRPTQ